MVPHLKTILYCTMMGPKAPYIFRHALAAAQAFGAKIVVLHVHETLRPDQQGMVEGYSGKGSIEDVVHEQEAEEVHALHQRVKDFFADELHQDDWSSLVSEIVVAEGKPKEQILRYVEKTGADLVVMGSHRHNLLDVLIGTTEQVVIAKASVPVLVVPIS